MVTTSSSSTSKPAAPETSDIGAFMDEMMAGQIQKESVAAQPAGDIAEYGTPSMADAATAQIMTGLLASDFATNYAGNLSAMRDYYRLLEADMLIVNSGAKRAQVEQVFQNAHDASTLERSIQAASGIICGDMTDEKKKAFLDQLIRGYIGKNRTDIESRLRMDRNVDTEVERHVSTASKISRGAVVFIVAAAIAIAGYFGYQNYQTQMSIQQHFGTAIQQQYPDIHLPDTFYQGPLGGGK